MMPSAVDPRPVVTAAPRRGMTDAICQGCGRLFRARRYEIKQGDGRFCSLSCAKTLANHPAWKGGRRLGRDGYVRVATGAGDALEHVVIAEQALGKPLPVGAEVHHVNAKKSDNRNSNLVICQDHAYHRLLHALDRVRRAGGRPFVDKVCCRCGFAKPLSEFSPSIKRGKRGPYGYCKPCHAARHRESYRRSAEQRSA